MSAANNYGFTDAEVQYQLSHRDETRGPAIMAAVGAFSALATISVLLRIWARQRSKSGLKADDYTIFAALVGICGAECHQWTCNVDDAADFDLVLIRHVSLQYALMNGAPDTALER